MIEKCAQCGKKSVVLYPHLWVYKRETKFFCSWSCLRKFDKEETGNMTDEMMREAVRIALDGGIPTKFLREQGSRNPTTAWKTIRKWAMQQAEYKDAEIPEKFGRWPKAAEVPTVKIDGPIRIETPEANQVQVTESSITISKDKIVAAVSKPKITKPVTYDGLEVSAVRDHELGEFYYDHDHNCIDWRNPFGDEVSLGVTGWKIMAQRIVKILNVLGVDA